MVWSHASVSNQFRNVHCDVAGDEKCRINSAFYLFHLQVTEFNSLTAYIFDSFILSFQHIHAFISVRLYDTFVVTDSQSTTIKSLSGCTTDSKAL